MPDLILAQNKLFEERYSCVLVRDGNIIMASYDKGIMPLFLKITEERNSLQNASMADKIVGKALALLSLFTGIKSVYGHIMSSSAKTLLENNKVHVEYNKIVPYIMNKNHTDKCIMEKLVDNMEDPEKAFYAISDFFRRGPDEGAF